MYSREKTAIIICFMEHNSMLKIVVKYFMMFANGEVDEVNRRHVLPVGALRTSSVTQVMQFETILAIFKEKVSFTYAG